MLPPLKTIRAGLGRTTEALAFELACPGGVMPDWSELEWRLAMVAAVAHGVSPLLWRHVNWTQPRWRRFLENQYEQVAVRHRRISSLLQRIDALSRATGLSLASLKGAALHALDIYAPGERPMADIDLLVREQDVDIATRLLCDIGYFPSFDHWRHRVFKPAEGQPLAVLGEHRDNPVNIELHTRIRERLPVSVIDITERVFPHKPQLGLNPYPSQGALLAHLLLHAAGNMCARSLRLMHLHDIALVAQTLRPQEWGFLWNASACWWALPPLQLVAHYYENVVPGAVLSGLARDCHPLLRMVSRHQTITKVSCSELWVHAFPGIEWSRDPLDAARFIAGRIRPSAEKIRERSDMVRTQLWLQDQDWVVARQRRRILTWLSQRVPRMDIMFVLRTALESGHAEPCNGRAGMGAAKPIGFGNN